MSACLVTVVSGEPYEAYAIGLWETADEFFHSADETGFMILDGRDGWPDATLYRYHVLLENQQELDGFDYVFLVDADMKFVAPVGKEILGESVATQHPGYVGVHPDLLPYERMAGSSAWVRQGKGSRYFCGGFVGGTFEFMMRLSKQISAWVDEDAPGYAVWHDESYLNRYLIDHPPDKILPPSFCYPDADEAYLEVWPEKYERILVALDKTPAERGVR